jgi:hypothetical protein
VQSRLLAAIGKAEQIPARKCVVKVLDVVERRQFFEATHLQGDIGATCSYGLVHAGEVVVAMSFGKRRGIGLKQQEWELLRFSSALGKTVQGGASRLLKAFVRDVTPMHVVSYCDLRWGEGKVYAALGFDLEKITDPDYWWVPRGEARRVSRYSVQKHKLVKHPALKQYFDPKKTEKEICEAAGWKKIHGVGHQKWVLTLS